MLYWHMMERDDDRDTVPDGVCSWCGSILTDADAPGPCCIDCADDWQAWRDRRVQPPEPLADGDEIVF
jgi:hypothetical protein